MITEKSAERKSTGRIRPRAAGWTGSGAAPGAAIKLITIAAGRNEKSDGAALVQPGSKTDKYVKPGR